MYDRPATARRRPINLEPSVEERQAKSPSVLVVEDDRHIRDLISHHLESAGYQCTSAEDGARALAEADACAFTVIVLDVMLPILDGIAVCRAIRRQGPNRDTPILILTARHDETDKVQGLESGADDYLTKPFSIPELVARVRALTRRARAPMIDLDMGWQGPVEVHDLALDPARRSLMVRGARVPVTRQEFALLYLLTTHPGIVFRRDRLLTKLWNGQTYVTERSVDALVRRVRRKIERNPTMPELIVTVWGDGYKLIDT
jgi:DNA-binding response OmpR family regulator